MNTLDKTAARRALAAVPTSGHADLILVVLDRIGGHRALIQAAAEAMNERTVRQARRRHSASVQRELRA